MGKITQKYWMVKQEPTAYSWDDFVKDGRAAWTGVRNFQARNNLRAMGRGDRVLFYHSVVGKEVVGIAEVARTAYRDPSATEGDWDCVDLAPVKPLAKPVPLDAIKANDKLRDIGLVRQSRLSVIPLTRAEFDEVVRLGTAAK
jgi:predicted RNA-binding protein with PUA-like domain